MTVDEPYAVLARMTKRRALRGELAILDEEALDHRN